MPLRRSSREKDEQLRLVTYRTAGSPPSPGVELSDGNLLNVSAVLEDRSYPTVARLMGADKATFEQISAAATSANADPDRARVEKRLVPRAEVEFLSPLGERVLQVCAGANYRSHVAEMGEEPTDDFAWFVKSSNAVIGSGEPIRLPARFPDRVDFEGELCLVFGRACHAVEAEHALSYIGGYTIMNDVSARDELGAVASAATSEQGRYAWMDMLLGKQFPTFSPVGPVVLTADEVDDPGNLRITTTVNGAVMQDANTSDLLMSIPELVARLSRYFSFEPGDVLSTGTPAGVGAAHNPPVFLQPGDVVVIEVEGIGALTNPVEGPDSSTPQADSR